MTDCIRHLLLAATLAALPRLTVAQARHEGVYVLLAIDSLKPPAFRHGLIPGEGTSIDAMSLELERHGRLRGSVVLTTTDSGSITDTIAAVGSWTVHGDSLVLDYSWSYRHSSSTGEARDAGLIAPTGISLGQFAGIGPRFFWPGVTLHFHRL